jgi:hypothetical protein
MKKLNFAIQKQEQTEWCWAAVSASIRGFYSPGGALRQCEVVNQMLLRQDCCDNPSSCNTQFNLKLTLEELRHLQQNDPGQPDFGRVVTEIDTGQPLAVKIRWDGGGNHFVVVYGFTDDGKVHVADPMHPTDSVIVTFNNFVYKDIGHWDESYFTQS